MPAFAAGSAGHSTGQVRLLLADLCPYLKYAAPSSPAPSVVEAVAEAVGAVAEAVASVGADAGAAGSGAAASRVGWLTALAAVVVTIPIWSFRLSIYTQNGKGIHCSCTDRGALSRSRRRSCIFLTFSRNLLHSCGNNLTHKLHNRREVYMGCLPY